MVAKTEPRADAGAPRGPDGDIRARTPYVLSVHPFVSLARRTASVLALILLDLCGLTLGVYAALVLREVYYGHTPVLWGVLWRYEGDWLPFLTLVTVLVFWQAGLYAPREHRAGIGRIVGSVIVVALVTIAFGVGTGALDFSTYGFFPTAIVPKSLKPRIAAGVEVAAVMISIGCMPASAIATISRNSK